MAYYEATGKDKLLKAAARFADYAAAHFGTEEGKKKGKVFTIGINTVL